MLKGSAGLSVARTVNRAPGVSVKVNWIEPLGDLTGTVRTVAAGTGTLMLKIVEALGIPFTNTVASAHPGGRSLSALEINASADQ